MGKDILLVDNNPLILKLVGNLLTRKGHRVETAADGLSALDLLQSYRPDIIFVDLIMPNISGAKICRIIRSMPEHRCVYIVILSAIAAEDEIDCRTLGANACIAKGPLTHIEKHMNTVLERVEEEGAGATADHEILGFDEVFQREITKELLASQRDSEILLNNLAEGILELTSEWRIIYANPMALELIGSPEERLLAAYFTEFFDPTHRRRLEAIQNQIDGEPIMLGEDAPVEINRRYLTLNFLPVSDNGQRSIIVIARDITAQKKAQLALQQAYDELEERVRERTAELSLANRSLNDEIAKRRKAATELEEANTALRVLLRQSGEAKHEIEEKVMTNIKKLITPHLTDLEIRLADRAEGSVVRVVRENLERITSGFAPTLASRHHSLTPREIQIADLIRQGRTNKEMAQIMNLSVRTVEFYRDNLRQKLGLKNTKSNLRSYLLSLPHD